MFLLDQQHQQQQPHEQQQRPKQDQHFPALPTHEHGQQERRTVISGDYNSIQGNTSNNNNNNNNDNKNEKINRERERH